MTYSLVVSPLDSQRLYVLTLPNVIPHKGTLGLYTSADQGRTWQLAVETASITSTSIYTVAPGNDTPAEVYIYLPDLGALGLRVSLDAGQHISSAGTLPFGSIFGLLAIPGAPGHLLAYGSDGMARSTDGGNHWQVLNTITGAIYQVTTPAPHSPIYASGDAGIYVSLDDGKTFKQSIAAIMAGAHGSRFHTSRGTSQCWLLIRPMPCKFTSHSPIPRLSTGWIKVEKTGYPLHLKPKKDIIER